MKTPEDKGSGNWRPSDELLADYRKDCEAGILLDAENSIQLLDEIALLRTMVQRRNNKITKLVQQRGKWRERAEGGKHEEYRQIIRDQGKIIEARNEEIGKLKGNNLALRGECP